MLSSLISEDFVKRPRSIRIQGSETSKKLQTQGPGAFKLKAQEHVNSRLGSLQKAFKLKARKPSSPRTGSLQIQGFGLEDFQALRLELPEP